MITKRAVTLSDIAQEANVAIKTASKVFNGDKTVRSYIKDHVLKIAGRHNYRPNPIAQAMRMKSLKIVSVSICELGTPFLGSLFENLYTQLNEKGFLVVPCSHMDAVNNVNHSLYACATVIGSPKKEDVRRLVQKGPVVAIDAIESFPGLASNLHFDFQTPYTEITKRILSMGLRKIAVHLAPIRSIEHNYARKFVHVDSLLKKAGLSFVASNSGKYFDDSNAVVAACKKRKIEAVFCQNDAVALLLMVELQRNGIRAPEDVLLIGCDGTYLPDNLWTIVFDTRKIAAMTLQLLMDEFSGKEKHKIAVYKPSLHIPNLTWEKNRENNRPRQAWPSTRISSVKPVLLLNLYKK